MSQPIASIQVHFSYDDDARASQRALVVLDRHGRFIPWTDVTPEQRAFLKRALNHAAETF